MYDIFFINSSDEGHLACYQFLAIMNKPACFLIAPRISNPGVGGTTNNGKDPFTSLINRENASQSCLLANLKRAFSLLRFPLPKYSNLYQVDPKLSRTNCNNTENFPQLLNRSERMQMLLYSTQETKRQEMLLGGTGITGMEPSTCTADVKWNFCW